MPIKVCNRSGLTLLELLVSIGILGALMGLLLVGIQKARAVMDRVTCQERLRSLALAFSQHHDKNRCFPPGHRSLSHPDQMPLTGWTFDLLAYIDHIALQQESILAFKTQPDPFISPPHPLDAVVSSFTCPSDSRLRQAQRADLTKHLVGLTSYLGVAGVESKDCLGVLFQDSKISFSAVLDGLSNTLLLGERPPSSDFQFGWWYAGAGMEFTGSGDLVLGVNETNLLVINGRSNCAPGKYGFGPSQFNDECGMFHFWSPHAGGGNFAFCDGSARFIRYEGKMVFPALASRAGGEVGELP